ncbi:MAG: regulatory protein RecX [Zetaproteobacteria bacterium]|nr:MAG: regulatory protein RecX [Zetaproteobacteria bacterium]
MSPEDERARAKALALRMLARREYCASEMKHKLLAKGFSEAVAEEVVAGLVRSGLLSDRRFAEAYLRGRLRRGDALWLAAAKARQKGVDEQALAEAVASLEEEFDPEQAARALVEKIDPEGLRFADAKLRRRMAARLARRGFARAVIEKVLKEDA